MNSALVAHGIEKINNHTFCALHDRNIVVALGSNLNNPFARNGTTVYLIVRPNYVTIDNSFAKWVTKVLSWPRKTQFSSLDTSPGDYHPIEIIVKRIQSNHQRQSSNGLGIWSSYWSRYMLLANHSNIWYQHVALQVGYNYLCNLKFQWETSVEFRKVYNELHPTV